MGQGRTIRKHAFWLASALCAAALAGGAHAQTTPQPTPAQRPAAPKPRAPAPNPAAQATLLGQYGDWGAYTASPRGQKLCFALAKPTSSQDNPPNRRTAANAVYMFVSSRPSERVKDEVSVLVTGYAFKPGEATLTIGSANFALNAQNDGAWAKNGQEDARIVETMRGGDTMVLKAASSKGTQTTDTFSLKGISQALDRVAQECR